MPTQPSADFDDLTRTRAAGMDMLPKGTLLAGRYRIEGIAGIGGMGVVYQVTDQQLDISVAIKTLRRDRDLDAESLERFRRETLLARRVSHPNVVRLHDLGQDGDLLFITMDYVPGQTLREALADGPMTVDAVTRMATQLAEALAVAHRQGIVHRDLKPSNILLDKEGQAYIMDFGVARSLEDRQLTQAGQLVGTPAYLAPEQVRGETIDGRADLFSLGLVLCEALAGQPPDGDTTLDELLGRRASGQTPDPGKVIASLPSWLTRVLRRCLAADPSDRYPDAERLLDDLRRNQARRYLSPRRLIFPGTILAAFAIVTMGWWILGPVPEDPEVPVLGPIAVLPLVNATEKPQLNWAGRSLAENLSAGLSEAPGLQLVDNLHLLRVMDDLGLRAANMDGHDKRRLAQLLELERLVSGHIFGLEDGFRIELSILDSAGKESGRLGTEIPGPSPLAALPALLDELATALTRAPQQLPPAPVSVDPDALSHYDQGLELISQGRMVDAIEPLRRAVEHDPEFAAAWSRLAQALDDTGQHGDAVDSAQTAVELLGGHGGRVALEAQARLAALSGDLEDAATRLQSLIELYPGDSEARLQLGQTLIRLGDLDAALEQLGILVGIDPQRSRAWLLMGQASILAGDPQRAADDYLVRGLLIENRLDNDRRRGDILNALGIARQRMGDLVAAQEHFEEAVRLRERAGDRSGTAGTRANLAHLALIQGRYDEAREQLAIALEVRKALGDQAGMADLYNELGVIEEELGDYRAALTHYREALRLRELLGHERALADSYNNIAFTYLMLGELDSARQFNRSALEQLAGSGNPAGQIMALETSGYLAVAAGDWPAATRAFLEALELSRRIAQPLSEAVSHGGLGMVARHQGRFGAAVEAYRRAVDMMYELQDLRSYSAFQLRLAELEIMAGQSDTANERLTAIQTQVEAPGYRGHLADWHRLSALLALEDGRTTTALESLSESHRHAERSGSRILTLQARLLKASLEPDGIPADLLAQVERIGHALFTLEAILLAARSAHARGEHAKAAELARRGLRPPLNIQPWAQAWELHWLSAADSDRPERALDLAYAELERLLAAMPESWHAAFIGQLPEEPRNVEVRQAQGVE